MAGVFVVSEWLVYFIQTSVWNSTKKMPLWLTIRSCYTNFVVIAVVILIYVSVHAVSILSIYLCSGAAGAIAEWEYPGSMPNFVDGRRYEAIVEHARPENAGTYTCIVGGMRYSATLSILGKESWSGWWASRWWCTVGGRGSCVMLIELYSTFQYNIFYSIFSGSLYCTGYYY